MKTYNSFKTQRFIDDILGKASAQISKLRKKRSLPKKVEKIAVVKLGSFGDSILCLPLIALLKKETNAQIIVAHSKENKTVFENQPFIDKKIQIDVTGKNPLAILRNAFGLMFERPDITIDLSYTGNSSAALAYLSAKYSLGFFNKSVKERNRFLDETIKIKKEEHAVVSYLRIAKKLGISSPLKDPKLQPIQYSKKDETIAKKMLKTKKDNIGIHCCHIINYKSWPAERFARVIDQLTTKGKNVYLLGSKSEKPLVAKVLKHLKNKKNVTDISGKPTLAQLARLMKSFDLCIANDGGVMHLSACMRTPTIGIFGVESPLRYAPFNQKSFSLYKGSLKNPPIKAYESKWPKDLKNNSEIAKITVQEVINASERILKRSLQ